MNELNYSTNNSTKINIPHNDEGSINIGDLQIKMAGAIGDIIVAEYMKTITEEEKQLIFDYLHDMMFTKNYEDKTVFKIRTEVKSGYGNRTEIVDTDLVKYIKRESQNVLHDLIKNRIDEIIKSEEYIKHVDEIAEELIEYALEGYKTDIKNAIRQNLVNNVLKQDPTYGGMSIRQIIQEEMDRRIY